jgi:hypothetical protein
MAYVPLGTPRFKVVRADAGEMLVIPAQRNVPVLLFLTAWFGAWTMAGVAAISALAAKFHALLAFWTVAWAIVWLLVANLLSWMLAGRETVQMIGGDLEIGSTVLGITQRKLCKGGDVKGLAVSPDGGIWQGRQCPPLPVPRPARGAIRFGYGSRTRSIGFGLDGTGAAEAVGWLNKTLPAGSA